MERSLRALLVAAGGLALILSAGFFVRAPWATVFWPWPDSRLSYIFVASILAAIAAPVLWIGLAGDLRATEAGALNLGLTWAGAAASLFLMATGGAGEPRLLAYAAGYAALTPAAVASYFMSRRFPLRDSRPMPGPVRVSFGLFAATLLVVGAALLLRAPHIFPWALRPESSVLFGWIYLGAAVYFVHGVLHPSWQNACGQLLGFLAYDLVLIGPFLAHFGSVPAEHLPSLVVYTSVLLFSGALASYYLFVNRTTRLWRGSRRPDRAAPIADRAALRQAGRETPGR
jgi:hypothetical protein